MPQMSLPIFSADVQLINGILGTATRDGVVYYFNGQMPIFQHAESDLSAFKMYVSQLYCNGNATQSELIRTFGITPSSIKRWVKRYREGSSSAFFRPHTPRSAAVLTPGKLAQIQELLAESDDISEISKQSGVKENTLRKAISTKKLIPLKKTPRVS